MNEVRFLRTPSKAMEYSEKYGKIYRKALGFDDDKNQMATKTVTLIVTEDCNLACTYCYEVNKRKRKMTKETAKQAIDLLFEDYYKNSHYINPDNAEALIIDFIGGEPLLAIDIIEFSIDYFLHKAISLKHQWAMNTMFHITTNGTLYFNHHFQRLLDIYDGRLSIGITIDGNEELHDSCRFYKGTDKGSYKDVEKAYKDYIKRNAYAATKLTLAPDNIEYLYDGLKNCVQNLDLKIINANCVYEEGWKLEHAKELYKQLKLCSDWILENNYDQIINFSMFDISIGHKQDESENRNWCGGTGSMLAFAANGQILPCMRYASISLPPEVKPLEIGTLKDGLGRKEEHKKVIDDLESITRKSQSTDKCFNCPIGSGCGWCSAYNYQMFGTPNKRATFICLMHQARVLANVYHINKYYRKYGISERYEMNIPNEWALKIIDNEELNLLKELSHK